MAQSVASFLESRFDEVEPMDYYREIFPKGTLEREGEQVDGKYCGIAIQIRPDGKARRVQITDELKQLPDLMSSKAFTMLAPVQFAGKNASNKNARYLQALQFDLDFLRDDKEGNPRGLVDLLYQTSINDKDPFNRLPKPTFIIASSFRNIHIVYQLDKPLAMYDSVMQQVRAFRRALIPKLWDSYISAAHERPQYETSPVQAFRLVGSNSKSGDVKVRCFRTGEKISIDELNNYVDEESRITTTYKQSTYSLNEAKELFPDWFSKRIEQKLPRGSWVAHRGLYDWFKQQLPRIKVGHRYHYLMCLCAFAKKCGIEEKELNKDVMVAREELDKLSPPDNPLTMSDATKALQTFTELSRRMPRATIARLSGIDIQPQKRNGLNQYDHLYLARAKRKALVDIGKAEAKGGRPNKKELVINEYKANSKRSISAIAKAAGVDIKTARKWVYWYQENNE